MAIAIPIMAAMAASSSTAIAVSAAAAAVGVAAQISQAHQQEAAADADARMAKQNQAIATEQAAAREDAFRRQGAQQLGRQAAATAQTGVDVGSGSAIDVIRQSAVNTELDAQTIRYQGLMQGFGFQRQAGLAQAKSKAIAAAVPLGVASTILGAASKAYGMQPPSTIGGPPGGYTFGASGTPYDAIGGGVGSAGSINP